MDTKYKLLLIVLFIIVIIAFIYNYTCNKSILDFNIYPGKGSGSDSDFQPPNPRTVINQCLLKMKAGTICPDCVTKINNSSEIDKCPSQVYTPFCQI